MLRFLYYNLIISIVVIVFFCYNLNIHYKIIPLHLSILIYPFLVLYSVFILSTKFLNYSINKIFISIVSTFYNLVIILIYTSYYVGIITWGSPINIYLILSFYDEVKDLINSLTNINYHQLILYFIVITSILFFKNYLLSKKIISSINGFKLNKINSKKIFF